MSEASDRAASSFLRLSGIDKRYGGVVALDGVDFAARRHSIHAVLGENGAGKSTLIKIISGAVQPDAGTIELDGEPRAPARPQGRDRARHRLRLPGAVADPRPDGRGQHLRHHRQPAVRADRRHGPAPPRRGAAGAGRLRGHQSASAGARPAAVAPPAGRARQGAGPPAAAADHGRGDLGADRLRRRHASTASCAGCATTGSPSSSSRTACTRSRRWPTPARCSAAAGTSRPSPKGRAAPDEIVRMMIGRDISQIYPPKPAPGAGAAGARGRGPRLGRPAVRRLPQPRQGRDRRSGRPRRAGAARLAAGHVRRAARPARHDRHRRQAGRRSTARPTPRPPGCDLALVPEDRKTEGLLLSQSVRENVTLASLDRTCARPAARPRPRARRWSPRPSRRSASRRRAPSSRSARCPAATSRRSCCRSGC